MDRRIPKEHKQQVKVNGKSSRWEEIISGIPQGTVLGPILFLIYINDLPELVASMLFLFADDSKIWRTIDNQEDIKILQEDLHVNGVSNGFWNFTQTN